MSYFSELLDELIASTDVADQFVCDPVRLVLDSLASQREIRFFVDGTRHFGHQASTVALLKRLIERTRFAGRVQVIYDDSDKVKPGSTASKLALLLVGLDPGNIDAAKIEYETCKDIRFVRWEDRSTLADGVDYGFTGAADDMSINFAAELRVKYFVRLQPYLWDDDESNKSDPYYECSRIEARDDRYFYPVDENESFRRLAYKVAREMREAVSDQVWAWYGREQHFDPNLGARTNNARVVYGECRRNPALQLWPLYGLHHFSDRIAEMALNIVLSAFQVQQVLRRPIVITVLNRHPSIPRFQDLLQPLSLDLAGKNLDLAHLRAALAEQYVDALTADGTCSAAHLDALVSAIARGARQWLDAGSRLTLVPSYDDATSADVDISERLSFALRNATERDVIVALLGPVPVDVYNYFYTTCAFPGLFEGQCSSSTVISLGRPFLQVPREGNVILNSYPATIAGDDYRELALAANDAALQLRDQRHGTYLRTDAARDPEEYCVHLQRTSDFILGALDASSAISRYFSRLGDFYQQDIHDKWLIGLLALVAVSEGKDSWTVRGIAVTAQA